MLSNKTRRLIEEYEREGWTIIIGNNPRLAEAQKWAGHQCVRLCRTNSKHAGWCIRTVWAVKPK